MNGTPVPDLPRTLVSPPDLFDLLTCSSLGGLPMYDLRCAIGPYPRHSTPPCANLVYPIHTSTLLLRAIDRTGNSLLSRAWHKPGDPLGNYRERGRDGDGGLQHRREEGRFVVRHGDGADDILHR